MGFFFGQNQNKVVVVVPVVNKYLNTDGVDYIRTPTNMVTGEITFSFWLRYSSALNKVVFETTKGNTSYHLHVSTASGAVGGIEFGASNSSTSRVRTTPLNDNNWHHIVATFETTNMNKSIYWDNGAGATNILGASPSIATTDAYVIGSRLGASGFVGGIDDVRIFNRIVTSAERTTLFQGGTVAAGLLAHYKLDGDAFDSSGNGRHGTEFNTVTYTNR